MTFDKIVWEPAPSARMRKARLWDRQDNEWVLYEEAWWPIDERYFLCIKGSARWFLVGTDPLTIVCAIEDQQLTQRNPER